LLSLASDSAAASVNNFNRLRQEIMKISKWLATICFMGVLSSASWATPVLQVDANGILTGATGVNVAGTLYDVSFQDGTCISVFSGCDAVSDFTFTQATASVASAALLSQVFVDGSSGQFDSNTAITRGCTSERECDVFTPFLLTGDVAARLQIALPDDVAVILPSTPYGRVEPG
jgi:hypothetical protein